MRERNRMGKSSLVAITAFCVWGAGSATGNTPTSGDLYFTTYQGGQNVHKVAFDFDGKTLVMGDVQTVATTNGADGLIFAPDNDLLVGGQGQGLIHKINTTTQVIQSHKANVNAYHLALDPSQTNAWAAGIPGALAKIPLNPFADGIAETLAGDDLTITTLAFKDASHAFYTSSATDGKGNFGTIDMATFTTHRLIKDLPGGHGMAYDAFTGTLMLFGGQSIVQIDPATGAQIDGRIFSGANFDQGTVDGKGHLFVANGNGTLLFMDYSATKKIGDTTNFVDQPRTLPAMDDVAPLSGLGANPNPIPNPKPDTLITVSAATYLDNDGNGRIDQVSLTFAKPISKLPTKLQLQDPFSGKTITVADSNATLVDNLHVIVNFKSLEFASGTGFAAGPYGTLLADNSVFSDKPFLIGDGVGPRPTAVTANPPQTSSETPKLTVTFSENVVVDVNSKTFPFDLKRKGSDPTSNIRVTSVTASGGNTYVYTFDTTFYPIPGDSLRIKKGTSLIKDTAGNTSNMTDYVPVGGKLLQVFYTLGEDKTPLVSAPVIDAPVSLPNSIFLVDQASPTHCLNCTGTVAQNAISQSQSGQPAKGTKPLLMTVNVNAPFHYDISFFDNLGTFVNSAIGDLSQAQLNTLPKDKNGDYSVGFFWWPVSAQGQLVGTGAYIARGTITTSGTLKTIQGSQGQYISVTNQSKNVFFTFGYIRP